LQVAWEVENTSEDLLDYDFRIQRSESGEGPFTYITEPFCDKYSFVDSIVDIETRANRVWYYRVEATVRYDGREARTCGDLRSVLGITPPPLGGSAYTAELADSPLVYYAPAYGALKAPRLDFVARDLTRAQPRLEAGTGEGGELWGCFFAPDDAIRLGYVTMIPLLPGTVVKRIRSLRIVTGATELWYLPFLERGRELECALIGTRYEASAFRGVRH